MADRAKMTAPDVLARKGGPKLVMITAYDHPSALIASEAGVDIILVGDSLANVVHGYDETLLVDLDIMVQHTAAVSRAEPRCLVVGDLPWMSYHISVEETVRNAGRLVRDGGAEAVKLEGGRKRLPMIRAILDAEIPVMGHIGLTPQSVHAMGGFKVQGRAVEQARELIDDARALADAGIFALVLEGVPDVLASVVTKEIPVPTIGIGAGAGCDGQVLVWHDALGLSFGHTPRFVRRYADLGGIAIEALRSYAADVQAGQFPNDDESYHMSDEVSALLLGEPTRKLDLDPDWPMSW